MPFKSSKGRNLGKKLPVQKSSDIGKSLGSGGGAGGITEFVGATGGLISEYRQGGTYYKACLLYTSPSPRDYAASRMPSSA